MEAVLPWVLSAGLLLGAAWTTKRRRTVLGALLLVAGLGLGVTGWFTRDTGGSQEVSSASVQREASFVLRADLTDGGSGAHPERLVAEWIHLVGVAGTEGNTDGVFVYGTPDATVKEMDAVIATMRAEKMVASVVRIR